MVLKKFSLFIELDVSNLIKAIIILYNLKIINLICSFIIQNNKKGYIFTLKWKTLASKIRLII